MAEKKYKGLESIKDHCYLILGNGTGNTGLLEKTGGKLQYSGVSLFKNGDTGTQTGGFIGTKNKLLSDKFEIKNIVIRILRQQQTIGLIKIQDGVMSKMTLSGGLNTKFVDEEIYDNLEKALSHLMGFSITKGKDIIIDTDFEAMKKFKAFELDWLQNETIDFKVNVDSNISDFKNDTVKVLLGQSESYNGTDIKSTVIAKIFDVESVVIDGSTVQAVKIPIEVTLYGYLNR